MNSREKYTGNKEEFYFFLKDEVIRLLKNNLKIEGTKVLIPENEELDYQIKFDSDESYGDLSIKVKWGQKPVDNDVVEENSKKDESESFEF
jgi:hypothetical protein